MSLPSFVFVIFWPFNSWKESGPPFMIHAALWKLKNKIWSKHPPLFCAVITSYSIHYTKLYDHEKVLYYYDEPKCSSFLQPYPSTDIFEIKAYIKQFFDNNGILVDSVDYSSVYNLYQDCESCGCLSGNRIYLRTADYYEESIKGYNFSTYAPLYHLV